MTKLICIAGGSGAGKSTLADGLAAHFGAGRASVLRLDDFQRTKEAVPLSVLHDGSLRRNYDHPCAIDWDGFVGALATLRNGGDVVITKRAKTTSMEEGVADAGTETVVARELVFVEGYLALKREEARAYYDRAIFLRLSEATRVSRRRWVKDEQYVREILLPMHRYFIEPTAQHASVVIDVDDLSVDEVLARAVEAIGT